MGTRVLVLPARQAGAVKTLAVDGAPAALAIAGDSADVSLTDGADTVRWKPMEAGHISWPLTRSRASSQRQLVLAAGADNFQQRAVPFYFPAVICAADHGP